MKNKLFLTFSLLLVVLVLAACGGDEAANAADQAADCPTAAADMQLLTNEEHGYCLVYPTEYQVERPNESEVDLVIGGLLNVSDPRVIIRIEEASGRSAAVIADQIERDFAGFTIEQSSTTLGGEEAIILDNLPGQDANRQVVVVHNGLFYKLTFLPVGADYPEIAPRTESLYATIMDSFRFLP